MPKGYAIFTEQVHDQEGMGAYSQGALPTILAVGAKAIVVGPPADVLEGEWHGTQTVILEFDSVEAARDWYNSPEYQAVIGRRHAAAETNAVIFSGFEMPTG
ncbi:MAG: DUF1330 domain-containing protein [Acidimicrobiales bacterium]